ncbi:ribonuclease H-like domain-containing protein [Tanacetum coccineum]|uniref:Ribonuclease H-like domain-containing protein n=1 Tax=Tanacetum coccineum TaxID=301880 RepID=A0ABQ4XNP7_9ASTR
MVKPVWNNAQRVNHQNFAKKTHPRAKKNLVQRAILMKYGLVSVNNAKQVNAAHSKTTVNAARPMSYLPKTTHSTVKRPIHKNTTFKNSNINQRVNTIRGIKINTTKPKAVVNAVKENNFNAVKASACWIWKPKHKGNPQIDLQVQGVINSGCSRYMTGNMSYLTDYKEIDGGYVAFGGVPVTILNTIDHLGKFDGKADEGFFVGYSLNSKAFKVFNSRTRIVEENLHIRFSESTPNVVGSGPDWLFDIDALTRTMNYEPIVVGTQSNGFAGIKASDNACQARKEIEPVKDYILLPLWTADPPYSQDPKSSYDDGSKPSSQAKIETEPVNEITIFATIMDIDPPFFQDPKSSHDDGSKPSSDNGKKVDEDPRKESECNDQEKEDNVNSTNNVNTDLKIQTFTRLKKHYMDYIKLLELGMKLIKYLLDNGFQRGKIDKTLFIKRHKGDILLVQVYVDDIIFGSTKKELCNAFEKLMHEKFQMSSMGELTFFLGLQVQQKKDGIFINEAVHKDLVIIMVSDSESTTVSASKQTVSATITTVDDIILVQALEEMKSSKPMMKGVVIQELGESITTISSQLSSQQSQDIGEELEDLYNVCIYIVTVEKKYRPATLTLLNDVGKQKL